MINTQMKVGRAVVLKCDSNVRGTVVPGGPLGGFAVRFAAAKGERGQRHEYPASCAIRFKVV